MIIEVGSLLVLEIVQLTIYLPIHQARLVKYPQYEQFYHYA